MESPDFWNDNDESQKVMKELKGLKKSLEEFEGIKNQADDIETLIEMAEEDNDESLVGEITDTFEEFKNSFETLRIATLLSDEFDENNAVININAGAGGTESCDWVSMLYRMYNRWAEKMGFDVEVLDFLDGDEVGYKSITFQINGYDAYGYAKSEKGVHRLIRMSPFNAAGKRQTTFAAVDVMPELNDDIVVEINDDDLKIDTYRASGAGGQHINKTSSAVRITHLPTGVVVQCQNERSQHSNKDKAMKMLKAKLYMIKKQENLDKISDIRGELTENGWGSQIRTYFLQPYKLVKDHRTNCETANADAVLNGDINLFINAYLKWIKTSKYEN